MIREDTIFIKIFAFMQIFKPIITIKKMMDKQPKDVETINERISTWYNY